MGRKKRIVRGLYKQIFIATDGSENSSQAINAGMEIIKLSNGKAYALHVMDISIYLSGKDLEKDEDPK